MTHLIGVYYDSTGVRKATYETLEMTHLVGEEWLRNGDGDWKFSEIIIIDGDGMKTYEQPEEIPNVSNT